LPPVRSDHELASALARGLGAETSDAANELAGFLARAFGPTAVALIHYGSHLHGTGPRPESALDFFVVLDEYESGYRSLVGAVRTGIRPRLAARLNRVLPPNVISVTPPDQALEATAKCAVISTRDLIRACSRRPRDHFVRARLFQPVRLAWSRDEESRAVVIEAIASARAGTLEWMAPRLPERFGTLEYCRAMLEVSYAGEIRPEARNHARLLLEAQRDELLPIYAALLEREVDRGLLEREGDGYRLRNRPGSIERLGSSLWFAGSKLRATLRWFKYVALYDDWLEYVTRKLERKSGVRLELTPLERRWPLVFLWPKALRYLLSRPQRRS
jgi:hypothetical protein